MTLMQVAQRRAGGDSSAGSRRISISSLAGPILLAVIVILFYWKLTLTHQYTWLENPDLSNQVLPWFQFQAGEWHAGRFPRWDPNEWTGQSLFGQAQPGSAYPLNWLLFLAPLHNGWIRNSVLNWYYVLIHCLAALNAYALARELGRTRRASILAGCVFALGGYVANTDWPQMINGAVWAPLIFLFLFRAERGYKAFSSALASGFFLGVSWLSGHHQVPIYLSVTTIGTWAWLCLRSGRFDWSKARLAVLSLIVAVMASGMQTIPTAEYSSRSVRWTGAESGPQPFDQAIPYHVHAQNALKPISLLAPILPGLAVGGNPFVGIAGFSLAVLGAILAWHQRQVRWLAAVALAGILFSLGPNSLLHGVLYALVPLVEKARVPAAATLLFSVGTAMLAAFGLDSIASDEASWWSRRATWILSGFAAMLAVASLMFYAAKVTPQISDDRMMITAFCAVALAVLLAAGRAGAISRQGGATAAILLVLFELANVTTYWMPYFGEDPRLDALLHNLTLHSDLIGFIRQHGQAARVEFDDSAIPYSIGNWYGIETFNSYTASVQSNIWQHDIFTPRVRNFLGIRYALSKTPMWPGQRELFQGSSGVKVFENPAAYPRVWAVHRSLQVAAKNAQATLSNASFDPRSTVFFSGKPGPSLVPCANPQDPQKEDVQMPVHQPNRVIITANLSCPGMVILTDAWFPGWRATVDGRSARIEEAYGAVRGVMVGAGQHRIVMRYYPMSIFAGALLSLCAATITGMAFLVPGVAAWRGSRANPDPV